MPKYRQLHTKIIDSFDFNEMPDDFHRVTWMLMTLILDCEGRGINNMSWVKSKMYPMRQDVTTSQLSAAFAWFEERGMLTRYQVNRRSYFYLPTFKTYQSGTEREAMSLLPPPPELLTTYSGVTPDLPIVGCIESESESALGASKNGNPIIKNPGALAALQKFEATRTDVDYSRFPEMIVPLARAFCETSGIKPAQPKEYDRWINQLTMFYETSISPQIMTRTINIMRQRGLSIKAPASVFNMARDSIASKSHDGEVWNT